MSLMFQPQGRTGKERFLRAIGMMVIFAIVGWAFWMNNQTTLEKIQARNALWDQTRILSQAERDFVQGFIRSMRSDYGVKVRVQVMTERLGDEEVDPKELYIGLSPQYEQVAMNFPGLVKHALGKKFVSELEYEHFKNNFTEDKWPTALMTCLTMIWDRLSRVESDQPVAPVYGQNGNGSMADPESAGYKE